MTIFSTITSSIGWWVGSFFGLAWAFGISFVAGFYGMYLGWKFNRDHYD